jgi:AcrR family transcriptional regulator
MSPDARRESILVAVIPLILAHGSAITTRQIAQSAGVAEGTIFRAFGDKESLVNAAVERFLDPEAFRQGLRLIDPNAPLDEKVRDIIVHMRARFTGIMGVMSAVGMKGPPPGRDSRAEFVEIVSNVLASEIERLRIPIENAAFLIRLVAFGVSIESFRHTHSFDTDELTDFVLYGIAGKEL